MGCNVMHRGIILNLCVCREPRPQDLEAIRALKDTFQQKDVKVEELQSRLVDANMARQQLQGDMQLREENWLANGAMRVGPSSPAQAASQAGQGRSAGRKSAAWT